MAIYLKILFINLISAVILSLFFIFPPKSVIESFYIKNNLIINKKIFSGRMMMHNRLDNIIYIKRFLTNNDRIYKIIDNKILDINNKKYYPIPEKIKNVMNTTNKRMISGIYEINNQYFSYILLLNKNTKNHILITRKLPSISNVYPKYFIVGINFLFFLLNTLILFLIFYQHEKLKDIHNQKAEQKFNERMREWQLLSAGLAHEIKNPLSTLSMFTELLAKRHGDKEPEKEYFSYIFKEIKRLNDIVINFLGFSRPQQINITKNNIIELVKEVSKELLDNSITHKMEYNNISPFYFDAPKIKQVLINIFKNAKEAIDDNEQKIINTKIYPKDKMVIIEINDNGPGLSVEPDKVLQPFFTTKAYGSGLGLSISFQIIKSHNGNLEIKNGKEGCIVTIKLPYKKGE